MDQTAIDMAALIPPTRAADTPWTGLARGRDVFMDDAIRAIADKAALYARAGANVHFRGMAGSGKTTLAFHVAETLGRPISFLAGNNWLTATDFLGKEIGQSSVSVVDRYVQTVRRTENLTRSEWKGAVLATAMERGHTLIYDEFTRASAEANSTLLSVLEEGVLVVTDPTSERTCITAHPCFRMLLTSNPHDYVGVNAAPDALMDRVLTLEVDQPCAETLTGIVALRSGLHHKTAGRIVRLLERVRTSTEKPGSGSMRTAIMIARVCAFLDRDGRLTDDAIATIAADVLSGRGTDLGASAIAQLLASEP